MIVRVWSIGVAHRFRVEGRLVMELGGLLTVASHGWCVSGGRGMRWSCERSLG